MLMTAKDLRTSLRNGDRSNAEENSAMIEMDAGNVEGKIGRKEADERRRDLARVIESTISKTEIAMVRNQEVRSMRKHLY
jgi:hypothetical protein